MTCYISYESYKEHEVELLKLDYQMCHAGYNSRDAMAHDIFHKIFLISGFLLAIISFINVFAEISLYFHLLCCALLGLVGILAMMTLLIHLESVMSCKVALRKQCIEIEEKLHGRKFLLYWKAIDDRDKFLGERIIKGKSGDPKDVGEEGHLFVWASRMLIIIWVVIVITMMIWVWHTKQPPQIPTNFLV